MIIDETLVRKKIQNGDKVHRTWMCFSPEKVALFCFCCTVFNQNYPNQRSKFNSENGFTTWRKLNPRIQDHEVSGKPGCLSYFSPNIQNELINLLRGRVRQDYYFINPEGQVLQYHI
jgi:hypothetical protein